MAVRLACSHTIPSDWRYGCLYSGGVLAATFRWKRLVNGYINCQFRIQVGAVNNKASGRKV